MGVKYGIGNSNYISQSDNQSTDTYRLNKGSLIVEYAPFFSKAFICSGVEYQISDLGSSLSLPLTFRLAFRKKIRPFVEGGAYYNLILSDQDDLYKLRNDFGAKAGCGFLIHMGKKWRCDAGYFHRFGFTSGLEEMHQLPLGQVQIEKYRLNSGSIEISLKYRF